MIDTMLFAALITLGVLMFAVTIVMHLGASHEGSHGSLNPDPPTWTAAAARRVTGLYVRLPTAAAKHNSGALQESRWLRK